MADIDWRLSLIIGAAVSVPLSVAANLLTPLAQDWYGRSSQRRNRQTVSSLEAELADIERIYDNQQHGGTRYLNEIVSQVAQSLFFFILANTVSSFAGLFTNLAIAISSFSYVSYFYPFSDALFSLLSVVPIAASLVLGLVALRIGLRTARTITRVRNFQSYQEDMNKRIESLRKDAQ